MEDLEQRALTLPETARTIAIVTALDYERAGEFLLTVKDLRKEIQQTFDPLIQKAHDAHKAIITERKRHEEPLIQAEGMVKPLMVAWDREQSRIREEKERLLREEARKQEEERRLQQAIEAELEGNKEEAEAIISEPVYVPPVILPKSTPKVVGISTKTNWKFRITDMAKIPREYLTPDEVKIGQMVRALKEQFNVPGIEAYPEQGIAAGRR
jgi:hypothetical protein